jgi:hypothetical protein
MTVNEAVHLFQAHQRRTCKPRTVLCYRYPLSLFYGISATVHSPR